MNITNTTSNTLISGLSEGDSLTNSAANVTIKAAANNVYVRNTGQNAYIQLLCNNSVISLSGGTATLQNYCFQGNNAVYGFNKNAVLYIDDDMSSYLVASYLEDLRVEGNNVIDGDNNTLIGAASQKINMSWLEEEGLEPLRQTINLSIDPNNVHFYSVSGPNTLLNGSAGNDFIFNYNNGDYGNYSTLDGGLGNDYIKSDRPSVLIGGDGSDTLVGEDDSTINAGSGDDLILSQGGVIFGDDGNDTIKTEFDSTIDAGAGNDSIAAYIDIGHEVQITGGKDNDTISILYDDYYYENGYGSTIIYHNGDGNDVITGYISSVSYSSFNVSDYDSLRGVVIQFDSDAVVDGSISGSDAILKIGDGSITLKDAADKAIFLQSGTNGEKVNISAVGNVIAHTVQGFDSVVNGSDFNDSIKAEYSSNKSTIKAGKGNDTINAINGRLMLIEAGDGNNYVSTSEYSTVKTGDGNNYVSISNYNTIKTGDGNNTIIGNRKDCFGNLIITGAGDDSISNFYNSTINAGAGNNTIDVQYNSSILSGNGNDVINIFGGYNTVNAGLGNNVINIQRDSHNPYIIQFTGGNTTINNNTDDFRGNISLASGVNLDSYQISGDSHIIKTSAGNITFKGLDASMARDKLIKVGVQSDNTYTKYINGIAFNDVIGSGLYNNNGYYEEFNYQNLEISGTSSKDYIDIYGANEVTVDGGDNNDYLRLDYIDNSTINASAGNDTIFATYTTASTINGGAGADLIQVVGDKSGSVAGSGLLVEGGADNDTIEIQAYHYDYVRKSKWDNNPEDTYTESKDYGKRITINGGKGNDIIRNTFIRMPESYTKTKSSDYSTSTTNSYLKSADTYVTIYEYTDSDGDYSRATMTGTLAYDRTFVYAVGDGNDTIEDYHEGEKIVITNTYTTITSTTKGNDVIINIGDGSITLSKARGKKINAVYNNGQAIDLNSGSSTTDTSATLPAGLSWNSGKTGFIVADAYKGALDLSTYNTLNVVDADASGRSKALSLTGNAYNNSLIGGKGKDTINGGAGDDTIKGGAGVDNLTGGAGNDVFLYANGDGNDVITDFGTGSDLFKITDSAISAVTKKNSDVLLTIGKGKVTFKDAATKTISIEDKDGNKSSVVNGIYTIANSVSKVSLTGLGGNDSISNTGAYTTITGGAGSDSIINTNAGASFIDGGAGNDYILDMSNGNSINGGAGNDTIDIVEMAHNSIIDGGAGNDNITLRGTASGASVNGGAGNDSIYCALAYESTITGGAGNDTLDLGYAATHTTQGGHWSNDLVLQYASGEGKDVINNFAEGLATIQVTKGTISKVSTGGKKAPNDVIFTIGKGNITFKDGVGKAITIIDEKGNLTTSAYGASTITITDSMSDTVDISKDAAVLEVDGSQRTKAVTIIGNAKANTLGGGSGNDELTGGKGKDVFIFSGGNDTITDFNISQDTIKLNGTVTNLKYIGEKSTDLVITTNNGSLTIENAASLKSKKGTIITTPQKITIIDSNDLKTAQIYNLSTVEGGINTMSGGSAADTLYGFTGSNLLTGGKGKDVFIFSSGDDTISDYTAKQDKIQLSNATISSYVVENKDVIFSFSGSNDKLTVTNGKDKAITIIDASGKETSETYNDPTELVLTKNDSGKYDMNDTKYALIKTVDATKTTKGVELVANSNGNTLMGGKGKDTLTGGSGADTFVYTTGGGNDTITNYELQDVIQLGKKTSISKAVVDEIEDTDGKVTHANYVFTIGKNKLTVESGATKTVTFVDEDGNKVRYDADYTLPTTNFEERFDTELFEDNNFITTDLDTIIKPDNIAAVDYKFTTNLDFAKNTDNITFTNNKPSKK